MSIQNKTKQLFLARFHMTLRTREHDCRLPLSGRWTVGTANQFSFFPTQQQRHVRPNFCFTFVSNTLSANFERRLDVHSLSSTMMKIGSTLAFRCNSFWRDDEFHLHGGKTFFNCSTYHPLCWRYRYHSNRLFSENYLSVQILVFAVLQIAKDITFLNLRTRTSSC